MGMPMIIGAGVGALGSAAMGKSPFTGALLGGTLGGLGGAGGLFGAAGSGAGTGIQLAQPAITDGFATALTPTVVGGGGGAGITGLGTQALGGAGITGLGSGTLSAGGAGITGLNTIPIDTAINYGNISKLAAETPLTLGEKFSNLGSDLFSYGKENPTSLLSNVNTISNMSNNAAMQEQQQLNDAIKIGNAPLAKKGDISAVQIPTWETNVSSPAHDVSPKIGIQSGNEIALPNLNSHITLSQEDIDKYRKMAAYGYRG